MSEGGHLPEGTTAAVGAAVVGGGGGFFWWLIRGIMTQREAQAEAFRQEVRADLKELKGLMQATVTASALHELRIKALEDALADLRKQVREMSEGR